MEFKLSRTTLLLWRIRASVLAIVLAGIFVLFSGYTIYSLIPSAVIICALLFFDFWYLPSFFKTYIITVTENAIIIKKGVLIKVSHIMPFKRLVFARSFSTPLAGILKLKGVTLRAARAALIIPEISADDADRLVYGLSGGATYE